MRDKVDPEYLARVVLRGERIPLLSGSTFLFMKMRIEFGEEDGSAALFSFFVTGPNCDYLGSLGRKIAAGRPGQIGLLAYEGTSLHRPESTLPNSEGRLIITPSPLANLRWSSQLRV